MNDTIYAIEYTNQTLTLFNTVIIPSAIIIFLGLGLWLYLKFAEERRDE